MLPRVGIADKVRDGRVLLECCDESKSVRAGAIWRRASRLSTTYTDLFGNWVKETGARLDRRHAGLSATGGGLCLLSAVP